MKLAKTICTHTGDSQVGKFHADEVFACAMLRLHPRFHQYELIRSEDPETLRASEILVDVGGVYDPTALRFDHHQPGFDLAFSVDTRYTTLSSAGLIYKHFGKDLVKQLVSVADEDQEYVYQRGYKAMVEMVDAVDNGTKTFNGEGLVDTSVSEAQIKTIEEMQSGALLVDEGTFTEAMETMSRFFTKQLKAIAEGDLQPHKALEAAFAERKKHHASGRVMVLPEDCKFEKLVREINSPRPQVYYFVQPDNSQKWQVTRMLPTGKFFSPIAFNSIYNTARSIPGVLSLKVNGSGAVTESLEAALKLVDLLIASKVNRYR